MSIPNLTIIGERINPGFASSRALLDAGDMEGIQRLALTQKEKGASYLTINVGDKATTDPSFLLEVIRALQEVVDLPLSFDYPHQSVQELCLKAYDPAKANGARPIVNSVAEPRWEMMEVLAIQPARVVLMVSERMEEGRALPNETAVEMVHTARRMVEAALGNGYGLTPDDLLIDVSMCPIATDTEGAIRRAVEAVRLIGAEPELAGVHPVVGLSNLGIMLPKTALDGGPLSVRIESAFLTMTVPAGLDTILGTAGRDYQLLPPDDFVLRGFADTIALDGFEALMRLQEIYRENKS